MDLDLFPSKEEWGTGDEAMDNKLSIALKMSFNDLTIESIHEFYFLGMSLKPRTFNPSFTVTIELVTKALFHFFNPDQFIDHAMKKMKGEYEKKEKIIFQFDDIDLVLIELKNNRKYRYKNQIDFSINLQSQFERNPYTRAELPRSTNDLSTKIIFKEFKSYLNGETKADLFTEELFKCLRGGNSILFIEGFAELWYHQDQIYSLSLTSLM